MTHDRLFCNLPSRTLEGLDEISSSATYPKGAILFVDGQEPRGVFVICNGRIKLSASAADGKSLILRIADPGEVVGLPGTISGKPYEVAAEALEPIQANFIPRAVFLKFLREHGEVALRVAEILSDIYHATYREVCYLGLSGSAGEKLARFLLDLAAERRKTSDGADADHVDLTLTHQEIAQITEPDVFHVGPAPLHIGFIRDLLLGLLVEPRPFLNEVQLGVEIVIGGGDRYASQGVGFTFQQIEILNLAMDLLPRSGSVSSVVAGLGCGGRAPPARGKINSSHKVIADALRNKSFVGSPFFAAFSLRLASSIAEVAFRQR
jgi:CRP/FNR family cyclic AMP-dependent transcriptional regulator